MAALIHVKVLHDAFERRIKRESFFRLAGTFQICDLFVSDIPKTQPLLGCLDKKVGAFEV